jgi:hypothetical protein
MTTVTITYNSTVLKYVLQQLLNSSTVEQLLKYVM